MIQLLQYQGEDEELDFKEKVDDYIELVKDIMAFANTKGGYIVVGVKEDKKAKEFIKIGLEEEFLLDDINIKRNLNKYLNIAPEFKVTHYIIDNKKYGLIYIDKSKNVINSKSSANNKNNKMVFNNGDIYERSGSESTRVIDVQRFLSRNNLSRTNDRVIKNNLPDIPVFESMEQFVGRKDEVEKLQKYIENEPGTLSILIDGIGGVGKTALVQYYAFDLLNRIRENKIKLDIDFIIWVSAKDDKLTEKGIVPIKQELNTLEDLFYAIVQVFEVTNFSKLEDFKQKEALIVKTLNKSNGGVIILDNLETFYDTRLLELLPQLSPKIKSIITSRHKSIKEEKISVNRVVDIKPMKGEDGGRELIDSWSNKLGLEFLLNMSNEKKDEFIEKAFGLPLIIINSLNDIANGAEYAELISQLDSLNIDSDIIEFQFRRSFKFLPKNQIKVFFALAFFDNPQTKQTIAVISGVSGRDLEEVLISLIQRRLIIRDLRDGDAVTVYSMEELARVYALKHLKSEPMLEEELRATYNEYMIVTHPDKIQLTASFGKGFKYTTNEENNAAAYASDATRKWKTTKDLELVERMFMKAVILAPDLDYVYSQWAWVKEQAIFNNNYDKRKQLEQEARELYIKACQLGEDNLRVWYQRGMFEIRMKEANFAQACFERGLDIRSDDPRCWHGLGRCYVLRGQANVNNSKSDNKEAKRMFERGFVENKTKSDRTHNSINWYYLSLVSYHLANSQNDYKRVLIGIKEGLGLQPTNTHLLDLKAKVDKKINLFNRNRGNNIQNVK